MSSAVRITVYPLPLYPPATLAVPLIVPCFSVQPLCPTFNCSSQPSAPECPQTFFPSNFPGIFSFFSSCFHSRNRGETTHRRHLPGQIVERFPEVEACPVVDKVLPLMLSYQPLSLSSLSRRKIPNTKFKWS